MTREELIAIVREELLDDVSDAVAGTDATVLAVSDARIARWLGEGEREACRRMGTLLMDASSPFCAITLVAGQRDYPLDPRILRMGRVLYGATTLTWTTEAALDRDSYGWRDYAAGAPQAFYLSRRRLFLDRAPSATEAGSELRLIVWREPLAAMLTDPEIPATYHEALTHWAAYRYFLRPDPHTRDDARAAFYLQAFEQVFGPAKSAEMLEFKLEDPGWTFVCNGGYTQSWHGATSTELTEF